MISFAIRTLPSRALSTNGPKRDRHEVSAAKAELGAWAYTSALEQLGPELPQIRRCRVDIALTFYVKHFAKAKDGLYRPTDPSNIGGLCVKSPIDYGLVKTGVIEDDDYTHVRYVILSVENVSALADERIEVRVMEVDE